MGQLFIVEILTRPDGPAFKRSDPMTSIAAAALVTGLAGLHTKIVPAEKYAVKGRAERVEKPEETTPKGGYRSKVD